jgi:predicted RNA-binding protein with PIN domain
VDIENLVAKESVEIILATSKQLEVSIIYGSGAVPDSSKLTQISGVTFELSTQ